MTENNSIPLADALQALLGKITEDDNVITPGACFWCKKNCGGTCLGVNTPNASRQMKTNDPAYWMLKDGKTSKPKVHKDGCYICEDPEFAQMGLPLCNPCPQCQADPGKGEGHIPADDESCDDCGFNLRMFYEVGEDMDEYKKLEAS